MDVIFIPVTPHAWDVALIVRLEYPTRNQGVKREGEREGGEAGGSDGDEGVMVEGLNRQSSGSDVVECGGGCVRGQTEEPNR